MREALHPPPSAAPPLPVAVRYTAASLPRRFIAKTTPAPATTATPPAIPMAGSADGEPVREAAGDLGRGVGVAVGSACMTCGLCNWLHGNSHRIYVTTATWREMCVGRGRSRLPPGCPPGRRGNRKGPAEAFPRGPRLSVPASGPRRYREAAPGGRAPLDWVARSASPRSGLRPDGAGVRSRGRVWCAVRWGKEATGSWRAGRASAQPLRPDAAGSGRPRNRPPWGDRAAVPCRPVTRAGARSHDVPAVRHTPQRSHAWFFPSGPAPGWHGHRYQRSVPGPVTGRTGESPPAQTYVQGCAAVHGGGALRRGARGASRTAQMRPRHSSSRVIASAVPGLPSASR
ncbi:hypothetical protein SAMN05444921_11265 [Streptomyces wuyuanensis]|uniref:Uncharacterized protein n=1 Tax=Streptomyces wuyuanensis TaxID=1196353 RepID=A0A1G9VEN0_9ACTN|nr:hypothetical protein SAMN05444921_11265 [Streptomyces wuyuanensis]